MTAVNVICPGKLKESYWRDACAEYSKRLGAYCKLNIVELPEARISQKPTDGEIKAALAAEAKLIEPYIGLKGSYSIALCVEAKQLSSEELSQKIGDVAVSGASVINFIIGSSFGLDGSIKSACDLRLGMSRLTLPHQLARVVLLEQIYRAYSILNGGKYHK